MKVRKGCDKRAHEEGERCMECVGKFVTQAREEVETMRFPPGVSITMDYMDASYGGDVVVSLTMDTQNMYHEHLPATAIFRQRVIGRHEIQNMQEREWSGVWRYNIYACLRDLWLHELQEWFTIDGEHYINPHPELTGGKRGLGE